MKNKKILYSLVLVLILLISFFILYLFMNLMAPPTAIRQHIPYETEVSSTASVTSPMTNETQIATNESAGYKVNNLIVRPDRILYYDKGEYLFDRAASIYDLAINGDRILWYENFPDQYITVYDLSTSQETRIAVNKSASQPTIYRDNIVWADAHEAGWNIYMYNLSTSQKTHVISITKRQHPIIYGDRIVYMDENLLGVIHDIFYGEKLQYEDINLLRAVYDFLASNFLFGAIHNFVALEFFASDIAGMSYSNENSDIYVYNLSTSKEIQITADNSIKGGLAVYGDRIVWDDGDNIYMYNLSTHKKNQITTGERVFRPAIYGDKVVWDDGDNVHMYDLSTRKENQVTTNGSARCPAIYGNRIVWVDRSDEKSGIYTCILNSKS